MKLDPLDKKLADLHKLVKRVNRKAERDALRRASQPSTAQRLARIERSLRAQAGRLERLEKRASQTRA
jgi:hypothetical protein